MAANPSLVRAECWFLDVAQGTSNVILLGDGRAVIIDCGPKRTTVLLQILQRYAIDSIEALVISHNDGDHDGGVARIISAYARSIKRVLFLRDRPPPQIRTFLAAMRERQVGRLSCPVERLEVSDEPQVIYADPDKDISVELLYPNYTENLVAEGAPNRTSGIVALFCGDRNVVFAGDATIEAWEAVAARYPRRLPLMCDIMTVPHHAGHIVASSSRDRTDEPDTTAARRLYGEIMRPAVAIVSVGSGNRFGHPVPQVVRSLRDLGITVVCTQITPHCSDDLEALRPGVIEPQWPSESTSMVRKTRRNRSMDVGCAGSIVAQVSPHQISLSCLDGHQHAIDESLASVDMHPLCRPQCLLLDCPPV